MATPSPFVDIITLLDGSPLRPNKVSSSFVLAAIELYGIWEAIGNKGRPYSAESPEVKECLLTVRSYIQASRLNNHERKMELSMGLRMVGWPADKLPDFSRDPRVTQLESQAVRMQAALATRESSVRPPIRPGKYHSDRWFVTVAGAISENLATIEQASWAIEHYGLWLPGDGPAKPSHTHPSPRTRRALAELVELDELLSKPTASAQECMTRYLMINESGWPRTHVPDFENLSPVVPPPPLRQLLPPVMESTLPPPTPSLQPPAQPVVMQPFKTLTQVLQAQTIAPDRLLQGMIGRTIYVHAEQQDVSVVEAGSAQWLELLNALTEYIKQQIIRSGDNQSATAIPEIFSKFGWPELMVPDFSNITSDSLPLGATENLDDALWVEELRSVGNWMRRSDAIRVQNNHLAIIRGLYKIVSELTPAYTPYRFTGDSPLAKELKEQHALLSGLSERHVITVFTRANELPPTVDRKPAKKSGRKAK